MAAARWPRLRLTSVRAICSRGLLLGNSSQRQLLKWLSTDSGPIDFPDMGPRIPEYKRRENETLESKRARLLYQSRKRGMSENGLLLSTYAALRLDHLDKKLLDQYDTLINEPSNDWEIFYWMTETKPTPPEYDNEIMNELKEHAKNKNMETRFRQPNLKPS